MPQQIYPPEEIVYQGVAYRTQTAKIGVASGAATTVISGVAGKRIVVHGYLLQIDAGATAKWSGSSSGDLSGAMSGAVGGLVLSAPISRVPWFVLDPGEDLQLTVTGTSTNATGHIVYSIVD